MALKNSSGGQYSRTDIAEECCDGIDLEQGGHGIRFKEYRSHGVPVTGLRYCPERESGLSGSRSEATSP